MFLLTEARWRACAYAALVALAAGCGEESATDVVFAKMDYAGGFFDAPFPSAHRDRGDGSLDVSDFPTGDNPLLEQMVTLLDEGATGFSGNAAIFIPFSGAIDVERLPQTLEDSLDAEATVFMVNVEPESENYGERIPIETSFKATAETYTPANILVVLPFQGVVPDPDTTYAVIVRRGLGDAEGRPLFHPEVLEQLIAGPPITGPHAEPLTKAFDLLDDWRTEAGAPFLDDMAAATVFRTGDPTGELNGLYAGARTAELEPVSEIAAVETHDDFCVVRATISLPVFQRGPKPYAEFPDGQLAVEGGVLVEQSRDVVEVMMTIPHATMPPTGFPLVIYAAGAEGTARQVIDRTAIDEDPAEGLGPAGQGPAKHYASRGVAAFGFPSPLTWDRHPDQTGGLLDFWNVGNLATFRDVLRQGALDFATLVPLIKTIQIDATACPEATTATTSFHFDAENLFIHGHSTGATIGGAAIALEPDLRGGIMSGAGGSWIYNVALAESPFDLAGIGHLLLDYEESDEVDIFDPALTLFQHVLEGVEVMSWGRRTVQHPLPGVEPKHLLHIEGVVDTYHFPRMANAYSMAVGLDLVEPVAEETAEIELELVGRGLIPAPARANIGAAGGVTAVLMQRQQNHQDGHYVPFEFDDVKYRYSCFISTAVENGFPTVPAPKSDPAAACD